MYIFNTYRINYLFIFEMDPRTALSYKEVWEEATTVTMVLLSNFLLYYKVRTLALTFCLIRTAPPHRRFCAKNFLRGSPHPTFPCYCLHTFSTSFYRLLRGVNHQSSRCFQTSRASSFRHLGPSLSPPRTLAMFSQVWLRFCTHC